MLVVQKVGYLYFTTTQNTLAIKHITSNICTPTENIPYYMILPQMLSKVGNMRKF